MLETYVVHVTKKCNCDCSYCYEVDKKSDYDWLEVRDLIDEIAKYNDKFHIEFLGGEPCLRIDLIERVVDYLPQAAAFTITTNGTIVNQQLIDLMLRNDKVTWAASIDGHQWANNLRVFRDGTNTHDKVIENLKKLLDAGVSVDQIGCHMTTHLYNVAYIFDSVSHLYDMGFRHIGVGTIESTMRIDDRYCNSFKSQMMKVSRYLHAGWFPNLQVWELERLKPASDQRHYIYDDDGKMIGESYGRMENDIISQNIDGVKSMAVGSDLEDTIVDIRKFVYDYHQSFRKVYGCGTGRCGSKTLAKHIAFKEEHCTIHEGLNLSWTYSDEQYDMIRFLDYNQVASGLINFADRLLQETSCKFVCVRRDKQEFIESFLNAHDMDGGQLWEEIPNPQQFPTFEHETNVVHGLDRYWEMYYTMAEELNEKFEHFQLIEFSDLVKVDVPIVSETDGGLYDYGDKLVSTLI